MKRSVYFFSIIIFAALSTSLLKAEEWQKFTCEEGGFFALYPSTPEPSQDYDSLYKVTNYLFMTVIEDANSKPMVYSTHYVKHAYDPSLIASSKLRQEALQSYAEGQVESFNAKMDDSRFKEVGGYQVLEYSATFNDGSFIVKTIVYLTDKNYISATVLTRPENRGSGDITKFLNSFALLGM